MSRTQMLAVCALLIAALGSPVALQNILIGISVVMVLSKWKEFSPLLAHPLWKKYYVFVFSLLLLMVVATALGETKTSYAFLGGYSIWAVLPVLIGSWLRHPDNATWFTKYQTKLFGWFVAMLLLLAAASISQLFWEWKISGATIARANALRARAFFSHPLTLAYVALIFLPVTSVAFFRSPKQSLFILAFIANVILIVASMSKIVIALAFLLVLMNAFLFLQHRARGMVVLACLVFGAILGLTDNPVKERFIEFQVGGDKNTETYVDDRVVFWKVHWEMFKEKPWLGHGMNLTTSYRTPYYIEQGFEEFPKKYEAHNTYLQIMTQVGVLGLLCWVGWCLYLISLALRLCRMRFVWGSVMLQALGLFLIAGVFQNSFQDAEVRYGLTVLTIATTLPFLLPQSAKGEAQT